MVVLEAYDKQILNLEELLTNKCTTWDSNPQLPEGNTDLNRACLPVSPVVHGGHAGLSPGLEPDMAHVHNFLLVSFHPISVQRLRMTVQKLL